MNVKKLADLEVKNAVRKELEECQAQRKTVETKQRECTTFCQSYSNEAPSQTLLESRTLTELGPWTPVPASSDTVVRVYNVDDACKEQSASVRQLSQAWKLEHCGLRKAPAQKLAGLKLPPCLHEGVCHCRRSRSGFKAKGNRKLARHAIQQLLTGKVGQDSLVRGEVVLVWSARADDGLVQQRVTYVAAQYLKPWRPTFLELLVPQAVQHRFNECFPGIDKERALQEEFFTLQVAVTDDNGPSFSTYLEFLSSLDVALSWWLGVMYLSDRLTPFLVSAGFVKTCLRKNAAQVLAIPGQAHGEEVGPPEAETSMTQDPDSSNQPAGLHEEDEASDASLEEERAWDVEWGVHAICMFKSVLASLLYIKNWKVNRA